ncbi:MAG: 16S rRNA (cytosine(967)-C(5))-methyltransferase RsmB [Burkholderiales bacterium]|nr:16S rRNA (cytosine(967)-C(5))-methyltransferase RsmB [Burkholderiales bacterium]
MAASADLAIALTLAAQGIAAVKRGRALDDALAALDNSGGVAERAAARDIAYRACRRLNLLDSLVHSLLARPNAELDAPLAVALSELIDHPQRAHRSVDQAVRGISALRGGAYKAVVNAILRRFMREREALLAAAHADEAVRLQHPRWWVERLRAAWPRHWPDILASGNGHPPMTLRVNRRRATVEEVVTALGHDGIEAHALGPCAVRVARPRPAASLPGFAAGRFSIQDLGAQVAAPLLGVADGMRVLDACAAPGGKTAHILEIADCDLLALDQDAARLAAVRDNLHRLGLAARTAAADAANPKAWWDGKHFDRILLDAPCTASGIVRRHPDAKWLKRELDIAALARRQERLLKALWKVLAPGGKLLYATCSVFPEENARQVAAFLSSHPDASHEAAHTALAIDSGQVLPGADHDGFYYAPLVKAV